MQLMQMSTLAAGRGFPKLSGAGQKALQEASVTSEHRAIQKASIALVMPQIQIIRKHTRELMRPPDREPWHWCVVQAGRYSTRRSSHQGQTAIMALPLPPMLQPQALFIKSDNSMHGKLRSHGTAKSSNISPTLETQDAS